ncbi:MAG: hypothetical protein ACE5GB_00250 [Acidimicrobiales bacterium]
MGRRSTRLATTAAALAVVAAACAAPAPPDLSVDDFESPFEAELTARVAVSVTVTGDGTVTPSMAEVRPGRAVELEAVPGLGQRFVGWTGDAAGTDNPLVLRPDDDLEVVASFEPIPPIGPGLEIEVIGDGYVSRRSGPIIAGEVVLLAVPGAGFEFAGWTGAAEATVNPLRFDPGDDSTLTATLTARFVKAAGPAPTINLWGGTDMRFTLGTPQRWLNVLGNVTEPDGIESLTYSLNQGPATPLTRGPDDRRLMEAGDFNIELDVENLLRGVNTVEIVARDTTGEVAGKIVRVEFGAGRWPLPYRTNWAKAGSPSEQGQIVDGQWTVGPDGIRSRQVGYDRLIVFGDRTWTDYEVSFPFRIDSFDESGFNTTSIRPMVGIIMRWPGHTAFDDSQPRWGYWPAGSLAGYSLDGDQTTWLGIEGNEGATSDVEERVTVELGRAYMMKGAVETTPEGHLYRMKVWPIDGTEPVGWTVQVLDEDDLASGSVVIVAHHADVTFGDVEIVPL